MTIAPSIAQWKSGTGVSTLAFDNPVQVGNAIIAIYINPAGTTVSTAPTDTLTNSFTAAQSGSGTSAAYKTWVVNKNKASGADTVTFSQTGDLFILEVSGNNQGSFIWDVCGGITQNSTVASQALSCPDTSVNANELWVTYCCALTSQTLAAPSGYTLLGNVGHSALAFKTTTATAQPAVTWNFSPSSAMVGAMFSILPIPASPLVALLPNEADNFLSRLTISGVAATGETESINDSALGNPANAASSVITGRAVGPTTQTLVTPASGTFTNRLGVPSDASIAAISASIDWECATWTSGGTSSWTTSLIYGANTNTSSSQSVTAAVGWATKASQHNVTGITGITGASTFQAKITPSLTTASVTGATVKVGYDNFKITVTYTGGTTQPDQPGTPTGTAGNAQVPLTWTDGATGGASITDHRVFTYNASTGALVKIDDTASATAAFTVTGLSNGTGYVFAVSSINSSGEGPISAKSTTYTPSAGDTTPPTLVLSLRAA